MFDDSRDFIQIHFYFSPRNDTSFWRANKELRLSGSIAEKLETYRAGLAVNQPFTSVDNYYGNFEAEFRNFWSNGSYYCILAGLGMLPGRQTLWGSIFGSGLVKSSRLGSSLSDYFRPLPRRGWGEVFPVTPATLPCWPGSDRSSAH